MSSACGLFAGAVSNTVYGDAPRTGTITFVIKGEAAFSTEAR
jgi:hypothetical protein